MSAPLSGLRVLVVEDEPLIALMIERMLGELGIENVELALSLAEAESVLSSDTPDLAILDINIGNRVVFPFAEKLRQMSVPILFSTARAANEIPTIWAVHPVVRKPTQMSDLVAALDGLRLDATPPTPDVSLSA